MNLRKVIICVSILVSVSCNAQTQINNAQVNNINENKTTNEPVVQPTPKYVVPPPTEEEIASLLETVNKNLETNGKATFLAQQPSEIVAFLLNEIGTRDDEKSPTTWANKLKIIEAERDLNHDGIAEKLIVALTYSDGTDRGTKMLHIFSHQKEKWSWLTEGLFIDDIKGVSFIPTEKKNEFDIMKYSPTLYTTGKRQSDLIGKYENYKRVVNGKYRPYKCLEITKKGKKEVSCNFENE